MGYSGVTEMACSKHIPHCKKAEDREVKIPTLFGSLHINSYLMGFGDINRDLTSMCALS